MLSLTGSDISKARRHPLFPKLMEICRSRMKWPDVSKFGDGKACITTLHHAAVINRFDGDFQAVVRDKAMDLLAALFERISEKDLVRVAIPTLCDAAAIGENDGLVQVLLTRFIDAAPEGASPGSAIYSRVLALETLGRDDDASDCAVNGFKSHPGLLKFFGTDRYLYLCGIPKYGEPSRWINAGWGDWTSLLYAYKAALKTDANSRQRIAAYRNLPYTLIMADGNLVRGGDVMNEPPAPHLPLAGLIGGTDQKSRWLRHRAIADNPPNIRCLTYGSEGKVAAGLPPAVRGIRGFTLFKDDYETPLLEIEKDRRKATWRDSPWTPVAGGGHSEWPRMPVTDRIKADGTREFYTN